MNFNIKQLNIEIEIYLRSSSQRPRRRPRQAASVREVCVESLYGTSDVIQVWLDNRWCQIVSVCSKASLGPKQWVLLKI